MDNVKKEYNYIKFIFFIRYFADAMFYSFPALYLASIGLKEGLSSTILSLTTITCLIVNPIWSYIAKNNKRSRILLFILSIIEGIVIIIYGNTSIVGLIMALTCLAAVAAGPYYNLLDGYAISFCNKYGKEYSVLRVMGSIAYLISVSISGILIDYFGFKLVFCIAGILFILTGIFTRFLKVINNDDKDGVILKRDYKKILKNKWFIIYMISYILIATVGTISDNFISLYFKNILGFTTSQYSFLYSTLIGIEVITIFILNRIKVRDIRYLFVFSGLCLFLRSFILSFTNLPAPILIIAAGFRGIAWGTLLFVHIKIVLKLVGVENVTTAVIVMSVFVALFQFAFTNIVGNLIEYSGYGLTYFLLSIITISATIGYFLILKLNKK